MNLHVDLLDHTIGLLKSNLANLQEFEDENKN